MDAAAPPPSVPEELPVRDWSLLPLDVLASVFVRLSAVDVLRGAGLVCRSWLQAAKVPDVWRVVDMGYPNIMFKYDKKERADLCAMAKAAVDRSDGQLREFAGRSFVTDELMQYIVERSPSLTTLRLVCCWKVHCWKVFSARLAGVITELPLNKLQSLELDYIDLLVGELIAILENCPNLDVLTVRDCSGLDEEDEPVLREKFARIKNLIYDCVGECFDDCWYDYGD
ncbi:putative F-box/LRR-repeat protein 23 [Lolium rigidum]|uniref:putative F-box/LRR-repeat protein 23 n=1 Tax=Lolium rigidum TaxID=89674 RepID=UPI001F5E0E0F|nr:putative F-box/LRR-repeat protein 23 [Lolium rigidum]